MHLGIFKLSGRRRFILAIVFTVLNFIQVLLGMLLTGGSIFIVITVSPRFYSERAEITFVFTVTGMFGTHIIITYLIGVKIGDKCYNLAHKKSTGRHLTIWIFSSWNPTINILIIAALASQISKHIVRSLRHSLEKGMHNYLRDPNWKHVIDKWQFNMQCCGINSYEDWHKVSWISKYHVNVDNDVVKEMRTSAEHIHLPVVPWSCCRNEFPMQCFHDPLQQLNSRHLWKEQPNLILESINNRGCLTVLRQPIEIFLSYFILYTIVLIILQIIIILISRVLYTSCKNAIILGDPDGVAPGWMFFRRWLGNKPNRTLSELLIDLGVPEDQISRFKVTHDVEMDLESRTNEKAIMSPDQKSSTQLTTPSTSGVSPKQSKVSPKLSNSSKRKRSSSSQHRMSNGSNLKISSGSKIKMSNNRQLSQSSSGIQKRSVDGVDLQEKSKSTSKLSNILRKISSSSQRKRSVESIALTEKTAATSDADPISSSDEAALLLK